MRRIPGLVVLLATLAGVVPVLPENASAFDLTGAWATGIDKCKKVFTRRGRLNDVTFTHLSGAYGGGFIAEPTRLRSKHQICSIKSRKEDGQNINLVVGCASGIMVSHIQFFLKAVDENSISRSFPGMEGMEMTYYRCKV